MKIPSLITLALLLSSTPASASTTLIEAWQGSIAHDARFAAAQAGTEAERTQQDQARSLLLPQVRAVATAGRASLNNTTDGAAFTTPAMGTSNQVSFRTSINNGNYSQWRIEAGMPLINAGIRAQNRQLRIGAQQAETRLALETQEAILRTARAFFGVILARETLTTLEEQQQAIRATLREKRRRFQIGDIPVTDSLEAEAQAEEMVARVLGAMADLRQKEQLYRDQTGLDPQKLPEINTGRDAGIHPLQPLALWQARSAEASPLITLSAQGQDVAGYEIDKFQAWKSPTISLIGAVGSERLSGSGSYGPSTVNARNNMIGVQLSIPIFTGGYRSAKLEEAIHRKDQAGHDLEAIRQQVARDTESAWLGLTLGQQRVVALRQAFRAETARLAATRKGNQLGDRSTLDLLNALNTVSRTRLALTTAQIELMMNRLQLQAVSGQLDVRELAALDGLLQ
jgi:outer membrane protein